MAHLVTFKSAMFGVSAETPNPINPIAGERLLQWLRRELQGHGYEVTEPHHEDWGWYIDVRADGASYMVGASADAEDPQPVTEWTVQIHRHRSFVDKLRGRNALAEGDPLLTIVERAIREGAVATDVEVSTDA